MAELWGVGPPLVLTLLPHTLIMWIFICTWSQSIHEKNPPSKNGGGLGWTFPFGIFFFCFCNSGRIYIGKTYISKFSSFLKIYWLSGKIQGEEKNHKKQTNKQT
jgi:hypothetical protein